MSKPIDCCCNWGAARKGEWPEFECSACPVHDFDGTVDEYCSAHTSQGPHAQCRTVILETLKKGPTPDIQVTISEAPPIVRGPFTGGPFVCPHGVAFWLEPTGEQLMRGVTP